MRHLLMLAAFVAALFALPSAAHADETFHASNATAADYYYTGTATHTSGKSSRYIKIGKNSGTIPVYTYQYGENSPSSTRPTGAEWTCASASYCEIWINDDDYTDSIDPQSDSITTYSYTQQTAGTPFTIPSDDGSHLMVFYDNSVNSASDIMSKFWVTSARSNIAIYDANNTDVDCTRPKVGGGYTMWSYEAGFCEDNADREADRRNKDRGAGEPAWQCACTGCAWTGNGSTGFQAQYECWQSDGPDCPAEILPEN